MDQDVVEEGLDEEVYDVDERDMGEGRGRLSSSSEWRGRRGSTNSPSPRTSSPWEGNKAGGDNPTGTADNNGYRTVRRGAEGG